MLVKAVILAPERDHVHELLTRTDQNELGAESEAAVEIVAKVGIEVGCEKVACQQMLGCGCSWAREPTEKLRPGLQELLLGIHGAGVFGQMTCG